MWNAIGTKAQKVAQGMSSAVAEIQKDLQKEHRSRGEDGSLYAEFDEAEAYKQMLVSFQMDQAKLGKEIQAALREKEDEAAHWKKLLDLEKGGGGDGAASAEENADGHTNGDGGGGALGVDEGIKLRAEVDVLTAVNLDWENKLKEALERSTEELAMRMKLEHEAATLNGKVKELDTARAASEDLILSLSAERSKMLGSSGEASDTIDDLVDEYSRLASEHTAQRQMDSETIQRLENVREELVEKLKAHERNILQLLARGEEEGSVSQEMAERSLVGNVVVKEAPSAAASTATEAADKSWTTAEVEKKLEEQAAELRAEKEAALDELRRALKVENAAVVKRENSSALALAAEGHAAAMKRAAIEGAAAAETRATAAVDAALASAKEAADKDRTEAIESLSKAKDEEREAALGEASRAAVETKGKELAKLREDMGEEGKKALAAAAAAQAVALSAAVAEAEKRLTVDIEAAQAARDASLKALEDTKMTMSKESEEALAEQKKLLEKDAEGKVETLRKEMEEEVATAKAARDEANALYAKENRGRKAIHNKLMDIQGNIRVLARVRPMLEVELKSGKDIDVTTFPADEDIVIKKPKEDKGGSGGRGGLASKDESTESRFEFDRVFRPDSSQEGVFEAVCPLVTSVLDGYNVCIFAYGQTGSGKTFTMGGPDSNPGVNTRAITDMFRTAEARSADVTYTFHMSMMEIYNEAVYDLLGAPEKDARSPTGGSKKSLDIRQNAAGGTSVPGLTEVEVASMSEVTAQLERGGKNRAVGAHDMNEHSSRSHMIFNVRVEGVNVHTGAVVKAKLNLIDLAGSERISKTDATGDRLREAQNINRSLSALGDVIAALATGKGHVPFRNSKLTFVLQDALSGKSKVMMFVNVSPASYNVTETLCSLNFAARCRSIKLGATTKNQEAPELARYRRTSESLHAQLVANGLVPSVSLGADSSPSSSGGSSTPSPAKSTSSVSTPSMAGRRKSHGSVRGGDAGLGETGGGTSSASSSRTSSPPGSVKGGK